MCGQYINKTRMQLAAAARKTEFSTFPKQKQQQQQNNAIKYRNRHGYNKGICNNNSTSCMPPRCPFL